jgi:hypothetical protein
VKLLERLEAGQAIASMGYPDIIFPPEKLKDLLGDRYAELKIRPDSDVICKRHGAKQQEVPDAESLFELFGASLDVYDIVKERGCEIVLDLNHPFPQNACEQYDHVLDAGTIEHCFNVAQAAINVAALANVGGRVYHENPFNWGNHGFYSLHPTWYRDFYEANGFELEQCQLVQRNFKQAPAPMGRFFIETEVIALTIAKRLEVRDFVFPTQRKYQEKK